jgi:hypothetical protein
MFAGKLKLYLSYVPWAPPTVATGTHKRAEHQASEQPSFPFALAQGGTVGGWKLKPFFHVLGGKHHVCSRKVKLFYRIDPYKLNQILTDVA